MKKKRDEDEGGEWEEVTKGAPMIKVRFRNEGPCSQILQLLTLIDSPFKDFYFTIEHADITFNLTSIFNYYNVHVLRFH